MAPLHRARRPRARPYALSAAGFAVLLAAPLLVACTGRQPTPAPSPVEDIAPESRARGGVVALRAVLPELRRLHPGGYVWSMYSYTTDVLPAGGDWTLQVMADAPSENHGYQLDRKGVLAPGITTAVGMRHYPAIAVLDGRSLPAYVESWDALARADRAAGREFRARTLGYIYSLGLTALGSGDPAWEVLYTAGATRLLVHVNAMDGSITIGP